MGFLLGAFYRRCRTNFMELEKLRVRQTYRIQGDHVDTYFLSVSFLTLSSLVCNETVAGDIYWAYI